MRLLISAGEASGDIYGAQLISALRRRQPSLQVSGVCGNQMRAAGCETVIDAHDVAVVGLAEVVSHLPRIYRKFHQLVRSIDNRRPDAAVLIDFPDFNLRLAKQLHRRGIPVIYYISPQLWAWRPGRVEQIKRYVSKMLVVFPFEEQWYRDRGVQAEFVGHPLASLDAPSISREDFARQHGLDPAKQWIALLPGSRRKEVAMNLPAILKAANLLDIQRLLRKKLEGGDSLDMAEAVMATEEAYGIEVPESEIDKLPLLPTDEYEFVLPVASTLQDGWVKSKLLERGTRVTLTHDARGALKHSRAAIVASGTATVEAALMGTPFVMVYRVSPLSFTFGRHLVKVPHYAMVNLIAGERVVPELVQHDFTPAKVVAQLREIIPDGEPRRRMLAGLSEVARRLRTGPVGVDIPAADRAADAVLAALAANAGASGV